MRRSHKSLIYLAIAIPLLVLVAGFLYMVGMASLEGETRTYAESVEWAAETLTTTGYGADSRWSHPLMVAYVIGVQFSGLFIVFLIFPLYLIPWMEERFEGKLPSELQTEIENHIVIYRSGPAVRSLLDELRETEREVVILEPDEDAARRLRDRGERAIHLADDADPVEVCSLVTAEALIANGAPEENLSLILQARQAGYERVIYALVEEPEKRRPLEIAGSTVVFTPRHILGAALAARASHRISPRVAGLAALDGRIGVREIRVLPDSPLAGKALGEIDLGADSGLTVIAVWTGGSLDAHPTASTLLPANGLVIVVGPVEQLEAFVEKTEGTSKMRDEGPVVIVGFGEVGRKVDELISDAGDSTITIDQTAIEGVDVVGNALSTEVLREAQIEMASAVVVALDSDDAMVMATVMIRDLDAHVPIVARVNDIRNIDTIHRAGADFALSVSQVTGQMLSGRILGFESLSIDGHFRLARVAAAGLAGRSIRDLDIRASTGASVIAIERGGTTLNPSADLTLEDGDEVYLCGDSDAINRFRDRFVQKGAV